MANSIRTQEQRRERRWTLSLVAPGLVWMMVFLVIPLMFIGGVSFLSRDEYGQIELPITTENYRRFFGFGTLGFDMVYPQIIVRSLVLAGVASGLCLACALPLAFGIAALPSRWKSAALTLVVIPLWTNLLVRTYAWQIILGPTGWLAETAVKLGWLSPGEGLYPGWGAVLIGLVADYLPFLTLPLYASVEKLDWTLAEAASDLGARGWSLFRHAILPQILPGMVTGLILVFVPATGQFVIPDLLGGAKVAVLGNVLQQEFTGSRDWPFGSAVAMVAMIVVLAGLWMYARNAEKENQRARNGGIER